MNPRPDPFGPGGFGAPPAVTGMSRLMPHLKTLAAGGFVVTIAFMVAQKALPDGWRPSDIAGSAAGLAERHEMQEKLEPKIAYERGVADATAQANMKAQADLATMQKVLDERTASLQPKSSAAGAADVICLLSQATAALTAPDGRVHGDWRQPDPNADWHNGAIGVARATCGLGDKLRADVAQSQLDAVRTAADARGAPMTNGATQPVTATMPAPQSFEVPNWNAVVVERRPRDANEREGLRAYADRLPAAVYHSFSIDLPADYDAYWSGFYDRVATYRHTHPI